MISIKAKRIISCENECTDKCHNCYKQKSMEEVIPKYYYLTTRKFFAVYSCEESICITISMRALRLLYSIIESYFMPICCTNDCLYENSQGGLRAYPTAVNYQITD